MAFFIGPKLNSWDINIKILAMLRVIQNGATNMVDYLMKFNTDVFGAIAQHWNIVDLRMMICTSIGAKEALAPIFDAVDKEFRAKYLTIGFLREFKIGQRLAFEMCLIGRRVTPSETTRLSALAPIFGYFGQHEYLRRLCKAYERDYSNADFVISFLKMAAFTNQVATLKEFPRIESNKYHHYAIKGGHSRKPCGTNCTACFRAITRCGYSDVLKTHKVSARQLNLHKYAIYRDQFETYTLLTELKPENFSSHIEEAIQSRRLGWVEHIDKIAPIVFSDKALSSIVCADLVDYFAIYCMKHKISVELLELIKAQNAAKCWQYIIDNDRCQLQSNVFAWLVSHKHTDMYSRAMYVIESATVIQLAELGRQDMIWPIHCIFLANR